MPHYLMIAVDLLIEPSDPIRFAMGEQAMHDLCDSIRQYGILEPIKVVPDSNKYRIMDGHRRFVAAGILSLAEVPCAIFSDVEAHEHAIMLHSNVIREDITAAEEGVQFLELAEKHHYSEADLCKLFGKSAGYINERCALVTRCPDLIRPVADRDLNFSQAKAIMRCTDRTWRAYLIEQAATHGASARTLQNMVDQWKAQQLFAAGQPAPHTPEHNTPVMQASAARCPWCDRDDDQTNMMDLKIHSYHLKDLLAFLRSVGVNRTQPYTVSPESSPAPLVGES